MRWIPLGVLLALVGCGDGSLEVRGTVTYRGKPVENGTIVFEPEDRNGPTRGDAITDGAYHLTGASKMTPGPKIVRIHAFGATGKKVSFSPGSAKKVDAMRQYIPSIYNTNSTLKRTVEEGKVNTFDFDLK